MSSPLDFKWKGTNFKTAWDHGGPPRTFSVNLAAVTSKGKFIYKGKITGSGVSCGQRFNVRNGVFDTNTKKLSFDMVFVENHPTETFTGKMDAGREPIANLLIVESIAGTVKVHQNWLASKTGQVRSVYGRYWATVHLYKTNPGPGPY